MRKSILLLALVLSFCVSTPSALARQPKKYQVTGKVLEVTSDYITVDKDGEPWEVGRDANTKVTGNLKVGEKVTIEYRMSATTVEVKKGDGKSDRKTK
jgi:hypothetical protein